MPLNKETETSLMLNFLDMLGHKRINKSLDHISEDYSQFIKMKILCGYIIITYLLRLAVAQSIRERMLSYLPTRQLGQDMTQGQFLSGV